MIKLDPMSASENIKFLKTIDLYPRAVSSTDLYDQYLGGVNPWPGVCGNGDENLLFSTIPSDNSNLTYGYCWELYDWCCRIPQITLPQYIIGQVTSLGLAYGLAFIMASSIYSKVLGPSNQVRIRTIRSVSIIVFL